MQTTQPKRTAAGQARESSRRTVLTQDDETQIANRIYFHMQLGRGHNALW